MEVKKLSYTHKNSFSLENISFSLKKGEILGIIGSNGSGKTTLVKNILGILKGEGEIYVEDKNIKNLPLEKRKNLVGYVPQDSQTNNLSVFDTIMLGRIPYMKHKESPEDIKIVNDLLEDLNLLKFKDTKVNHLSGGERQRVYIARALAQNSKILILDEPTSNLDIANSLCILNLIKEIVISKNIICLIVIHDLNLAQKFCSSFLLLKNGKNLAFGNKTEIFKEDILKELFEVNVNIFNFNNEIFISPYL